MNELKNGSKNVGVETYEDNPLIKEAGGEDDIPEDHMMMDLPMFGNNSNGVEQGAEPPSPTDGKKKRRRKKKDANGEVSIELSPGDDEEIQVEHRNFLVVVLGAAGVGKTAVAMQYCAQFFPRKYEPTISEKYRKKVTMHTTMIRELTIDILDTAGQEDYCTLPEEYLQDGDAFLIVYGADSQVSFENVDEVFTDLEENRDDGDQVPVVLCCNRVDLEQAGKRVVEEQAGIDKIEEWKSNFTLRKSKIKPISYVECSAKSNLNVDLAFQSVIDALVHRLDEGNTYVDDEVQVANNSWCQQCQVS